MRFILILFLLPVIGIAQSTDTTMCNSSCNCKNDPTPSGIMISHVHSKNEWMISYRFMYMSMEGLASGTQTKSESDVLTDYMMATTKMRMDMHMIMAMYGLTDRLTIMVMLNYNFNSMEMQMPGSSGQLNHNSMTHIMGTSGLSDTKLHLLYGLIKKANHQLLIGLGANIPTGTIQLKGKTHATMYANQRFPYAMQLGSGTYDIMPCLNYLYQKDRITFSVQGSGIFRPFLNKVGYSLGNEATTNVWLAYKCLNFLTTSIRAEGNTSGKIIGKDPTLYYYSELSANPNNYGGQKLSSFAGLVIHFQKGWIKNNRISFEYGMPLYQSLNGIQMRSKQTIYTSWSITF